MQKELIGASTIPLLLTVLQSGDHYGYDLIKKVKDISGGNLEWSEAMLYPVLHRLEKQGSIHSRWEVLQTGRKRKYYGITEAGKELLFSKRGEWMKMINLMGQLWGFQISES